MIKRHHDGQQYWKCEMCPAFATERNAIALGWDWFTGTLSRTHHYCVKCKTSKEHAVMMKHAQVAP